MSPITQTRQRQQHTRSRNGCLSCKRRHVRCNEGRPTCAQCLVRGWGCNYDFPAIPLRERRGQKIALPGTSLLHLIISAPADPFDTLPIQMGARSCELLSYFTRAKYEASCCGNTNYPASLHAIIIRSLPITTLMSDPIPMNMDEPIGLRSTLLLAGLHFKLATGGAQLFDETFWFHKGEAIRCVTQGISDPNVRTRPPFMKLVATLSMLESTVGNLAVADAHINGLLTLLELQDSRKRVGGARQVNATAKMAQEDVLLMAHHFAGSMRSRVVEAQAHFAGAGGAKCHPHYRSLADNLSNLRLMPHFFPETLSSKTDLLDGVAVISSLRGITYAFNKQSNLSSVVSSPLGAATAICDDSDYANCIGCKSMVGVPYALTVTHGRHSSQVSRSYDTSLLSTWCSLATGASFYLHSVVHVWNAGLPIEPRLYGRLLAMHKREMEISEESLLNRGEGPEMWLWQSFVAVYILRSSQPQRNGDRQTPDRTNYHDVFDEHLRRWSTVAGVVDWEEARASLEKVVWPDMPSVEDRARQIWEEIVL